MIPHLVELQDRGIRVRTPDETLARSPGFASIAGKAPVFGEAARQQARLHPRQSYNQFWAQLSLDPLNDRNKHFRHTADLAFGHLDALTRPLDFPHGAVLAAPGNYTRQQLAVLLGLVKQCNFDAVGLVDHALLQVAGSPATEAILIDLQLHQAVLTSFRKMDGHLLKESVVQVPFAGLLALQDSWTSMITEEFIRQSRFNPLHNAETEQYLYDHLEQWLAASLNDNELLIDINLKGAVHQARLTREQLERRSKSVFARVTKELDELRGPDTVLHVAASQLHLPGLARHIPGLVALDDDATVANCMEYLDQITRSPDSLQFVTRLALHKDTVSNAIVMPQRIPSHILLNHRAMLLPAGRLALGTPAPGLDSARIVPLPQAGSFSGAIALVRTSRGVQLELHSGTPVLVNAQAPSEGQMLQTGDSLRLGQDLELQLISVEQTA